MGGIAAGALIAGRPEWRVIAACAIAGALPDIDFVLPVQHRGPTHGLGSAVLAFAAALTLFICRAPAGGRWRIAAAIGLAYASHTLLDWLGADSSNPRGLMALWPVSSSYYMSGLDVFNSVDRRYWTAGFWTRTAIAVLREIAILGPPAVISVSGRRLIRSYQRRGAVPPPD